MSSPETAPDAGDPVPAAPRRGSPRGDFFEAIAWIALGVATAIGAWNMDRLERQDVNPYTVPGLLPGLLGVAIVFFGVLLAARAWRQGALGDAPGTRAAPTPANERRRLWTVLALCVGYVVGLVGHGLPFWVASAAFVAVTIVLLQRAERVANGQPLRGLVVAAVIGVASGIVTTIVFQELFLVRLP